MKDYKLRYGWCATRELEPYLNNLKQITRTCVEIRGKWGALAFQNRGLYGTLVGFGILGGTTVLIAPILTVAKVENVSFDVGLLLTTIGAAVTGIATLWLQIGNYGEKTNNGFEKLADFEKLIQASEVEWQAHVCQASSQPLAIQKAASILTKLSKECVNAPPKVKVDVDIAGAVQKQQKNVENIITSYSSIQNHTESQSNLRDSKQALARLVKRIEATRSSITRAGKNRKKISNLSVNALVTELKSLCAQAEQEHKRYVSLLRNSRKKSDMVVAKGGWYGICTNATAEEKTIKNKFLEQAYNQSQKTLNQLIQKIHRNHNVFVAAKSLKTRKKAIRFRNRSSLEQRVSGQKSKSNLKQAIIGLCRMAYQEYHRSSALETQLKLNDGKAVPAGSWLIICNTYDPNLTK